MYQNESVSVKWVSRSASDVGCGARGGVVLVSECSAIRVLHRYGNTHGVSKMGNMGTGTVLDFNTPCTCTAVLWVCTGILQ